MTKQTGKREASLAVMIEALEAERYEQVPDNVPGKAVSWLGLNAIVL